jgi:hypothetical protein
MKYFFITLILLTLSILSFSQTEKKHFLVGGSLTGSYDQHDAVPDHRWKNKIWTAGLYPRAGYFVCKNLAFGLALTAAYSHVKQIYPDGLPSTTHKTYLEGIGFFGRYYYRREKNALIGELLYSFDRNRDVYETLDLSNPVEINRIKYNGQNNTYYVGIGYTRFITDKLGLEIMIRYRYRYDHAVDGHNNFAAESRSNGVTAGFGFQVYL